MRVLLLTLALSAAACTADGTILTETDDTDVLDTGDTNDGDTGTDTDTDDTGDTGVACTAAISAFRPIDNAIDIGVDATVSVQFTDVVLAEHAWSLTVDGAPGEATLAEDGRSATWQPAPALHYDTEYTARASVCSRPDATSGFRTEESVVIDPTNLVGRDYVVRYDEVTWEKPAVVSVFSDEIALEYLLIEVLAHDDSTNTLDLVGAVGETAPRGGIRQSQCMALLDYADVDFSANPTFNAGPADLAIPYADVVFTIAGLTTRGTFADEGDRMIDVEMSGLVDTRPLDALVGTFEICPLSLALGEPCVPCADGVKKCLDAVLVADEARYDATVDIDEAYDPTADPTCW